MDNQSESVYESDDPMEQITMMKEKLSSNSSFVASLPQKCVEDKSTLVYLNKKINDALFMLRNCV